MSLYVPSLFHDANTIDLALNFIHRSMEKTLASEGYNRGVDAKEQRTKNQIMIESIIENSKSDRPAWDMSG